MGGGGIAPICPFITESILSVPQNRKMRTSYSKSIISRVANSVMGWTLRPVDTRPEGPRAGVGFLAGGSEPLTHQIGNGSTVSSLSGVRDGAPENMDFGTFWDLRNHVRMVS